MHDGIDFKRVAIMIDSRVTHRIARLVCRQAIIYATPTWSSSTRLRKRSRLEPDSR